MAGKPGLNQRHDHRNLLRIVVPALPVEADIGAKYELRENEQKDREAVDARSIALLKVHVDAVECRADV